MVELPWNRDTPSSLKNEMSEKGSDGFSFGFRLGKWCTDDGFSWINRLKVKGAQWRFGNGQGDWWLKKRRRIAGGFGALGYDLEASGVVEINGGSKSYGGWIE
ncbi:hypothetical protein V6N13_041281 [Hibiscus sabdariffa]|uniref:Uncharacterized protein n=1 Tax=Hibiscus sabdariffa TaxID=183260 RepID=A0ABR2RBN7_9ROSI